MNIEIGHLNFLEHIYQEVVIPPAVAAEISSSVSLPSWIQIRSLSQSVVVRFLEKGSQMAPEAPILFGVDD